MVTKSPPRRGCWQHLFARAGTCTCTQTISTRASVKVPPSSEGNSGGRQAAFDSAQVGQANKAPATINYITTTDAVTMATGCEGLQRSPLACCFSKLLFFPSLSLRCPRRLRQSLDRRVFSLRGRAEL